MVRDRVRAEHTQTTHAELGVEAQRVQARCGGSEGTGYRVQTAKMYGYRGVRIYSVQGAVCMIQSTNTLARTSVQSM